MHPGIRLPLAKKVIFPPVVEVTEALIVLVVPLTAELIPSTKESETVV
jgi:hypothetical protein